jgi:hypothetical protein
MALELKQQLRLSQQLVMTPQLQQAIKLLQLNRLELVTVVQQELEENPVLEEAMEGEDDPAGGADESPEASEAAAEAAPEPSVEAAEDREPTDAEKIADIDWQNYMEAFPQTGMREPREDEDRSCCRTRSTRRWPPSSSSETSTSVATWRRRSRRSRCSPACPRRWSSARWPGSRTSIRRALLRVTCANA